MSRKSRRGKRRSVTPWIILALVVVTAVVGYYIFTQSGAGSGSPLDGQPVSPVILTQLSGVSANTLNSVGSGPASITALKPVSSTTLLVFNGKPEVLYMGAEYCPFCAAERWSMVVALEKFGNFTGLQYTQSAPSPEAFPNTSTLTFRDATYISNYIAFVSVEQQDRNNKPLQTATSAQTALLTTYDSAGSIPFVDFGNQYTLVGSQFSPVNLRVGSSATGAPNDWTTIASQLDNASSNFAQNINGAANHLISAICKIDGGKPANVCSQNFAQVLRFTVPGSGSQLLASDAVLRGASPSLAAPRYAPNRLTARV